MNKKIARITNDKKLLLANEIVEDNRYSLNEHGKLYTKNILEGNKFSIDDEFIEVGEFIEGYPFVKPVIDDSLVLWLDGSTGNNYEQTGTWKDLSGNGNDGELRNFGYTENSGWVDGGLRFDGVDDAIKSSPIVLDKSFTLSVVFKYSSKEVEASVIFNLPYAKSYGWNIALGFSQRYLGDSVQVTFFYKKENGSIRVYYSPSITLVDGEKYTLSARFDYNTKTIFFIKDNQIVSSDTLTEFNEHVENRGIGVGWGSNGPAKRQHILYDIKLYNRALTDEEIMQNYQAGQCSPLLAMRGDIIG